MPVSKTDGTHHHRRGGLGLTSPWEEGTDGISEHEVGRVVTALERWRRGREGFAHASLEALLLAWGGDERAGGGETESGGLGREDERMDEGGGGGGGGREGGVLERGGGSSVASESMEGASQAGAREDGQGGAQAAEVGEEEGQEGGAGLVSQEERGLLEKVTSDAEGMERLRGAWEESVEIRAWLRQVNVRVLHVQRALPRVEAGGVQFGERTGTLAVADKVAATAWRWEHLRVRVKAEAEMPGGKLLLAAVDLLFRKVCAFSAWIMSNVYDADAETRQHQLWRGHGCDAREHDVGAERAAESGALCAVRRSLA
eukprot:2632378-Rhodomonas_salina.1